MVQGSGVSGGFSAFLTTDAGLAAGLNGSCQKWLMTGHKQHPTKGRSSGDKCVGLTGMRVAELSRPCGQAGLINSRPAVPVPASLNRCTSIQRDG